MSDVIVLQNDMDWAGVRRLHVMADEPIDQAQAWRRWAHVEMPLRLEVRTRTDEIRLHHLEAEFRPREAMYFTFTTWGDETPRPVAVWTLEPGQRISEAAVDAALVFYGTFDYWPSVAWVRRWPQGLAVEQAYIPLAEDAGMDLMDVPWATEGCVIVGGNFHRRS
jgi:hypothetical protein